MNEYQLTLLRHIKKVATEAINTRSRDVHDWAEDMAAIEYSAGLLLADEPSLDAAQGESK